MTEAIDYVKTDLMPDFDFDAYNHDQVVEMEGEPRQEETAAESVSVMDEVKADTITASPASSLPLRNDEEVDKW